MTRLRLLKQRARRAHIWMYRTDENRKRFDIYVEAETILGPRGLSLTRRQATQLAAQIACHPAGPVKFSVCNAG